jgi:peptidyl-prolyl cis-trans isomerase SurA
VNTAMSDRFSLILKFCRPIAAAIVLGAAMSSACLAQNVVVIVNGEPITALDIDQRSKLDTLSTHKTPSRQEVLDELIDDILKIKEGKKWNLEVSDSEVDSSFNAMAGRMRMNGEQLTQVLAKSGIGANILKSRIRADSVWQQLVRGRFQSSLQVADEDVLAALQDKKTDDADETTYDYTMRPILFIVAPGSSEAVIDGRKREAEALRVRFKSCGEGLIFARALPDVAVRDQIVRNSADIPPDVRKVVDGVAIGSLTSPEVTKLGVEMYAICAKNPSKADNSSGKRKAREAVFAERFEQQSKRYLQEIRRSAWIERK